MFYNCWLCRIIVSCNYTVRKYDVFLLSLFVAGHSYVRYVLVENYEICLFAAPQHEGGKKSPSETGRTYHGEEAYSGLWRN
jgi:hypothetical protein